MGNIERKDFKIFYKSSVLHIGNKTSYITRTFASIPLPKVQFIVNSENFDKFVYPVTEMSPILNFRKEEGFLIFDKFFIDQHAQIYSIYSDEFQRRGLLVGERRVTIGMRFP